MTRLRFKAFLLRLALGTYRAAGVFGRHAAFFFLWIGRGLRWGAKHAAMPPAQFVYQAWFTARLRTGRILQSLGGTFFGTLAHRHIIHIMMVFLVAVTSGLSLATRTTRAEELGTASILYELVVGTSEELILEEVPLDPDATQPPSLVDITALGAMPNIDFDYLDEELAEPFTALVARRASTAPAVASRTEITKYLVQSGDTASTIAEEFGLSLTTLLWANKLAVTSYIRPGQELIIPPLDGVLHTVKKGDTVEKLAKTYQSEARDILAWNRIGEDGALTVGETLVVPGGKQPAPPVRRVSSPSTLFTGVRPADGTSPGTGRLFWPVAARRFTQYFGWRHTGVDIAGPTGTAIYAAADGVVEFSGWGRGYGQHIVIDHGNGMKTRYAHNSKNYVSKGNTVARGATIAAVGSTGRSTGPHLHFEVIMSGRFRNPLEFIR